MIPRIADAIAQDNFQLLISFDDGVSVLYDVKDDIDTIPPFKTLEGNPKMFNSFVIDESRTVISWTDQIELPSDTLREYGKTIA